ncbi:MAG TPA: hypothetical protein VMJ65_09375 [Solirubrobacteraceae bacterium]|nr:hypothetical protein [Solirubrobacteraceae bacterium]
MIASRTYAAVHLWRARIEPPRDVLAVALGERAGGLAPGWLAGTHQLDQLPHEVL